MKFFISFPLCTLKQIKKMTNEPNLKSSTIAITYSKIKTKD